MKRRRVLVESPFAGRTRAKRREHRRYLLACLRDATLNHNEAPYASHLFFTQFLNDNDSDERAVGIAAGLLWGEAAEATIVYTDYGVSRGMQIGIDAANAAKRPIEFRQLAAFAPLDLQAARERARELLATTAAHLGVPKERIVGPQRNRSTTRARHVAIRAMREATTLSTTHIGEIVRRDHSTVLAALEKVASDDPFVVRVLAQI